MPDVDKNDMEWTRLLNELTAASDAYVDARDDAGRSAAYDRYHDASHALMDYMKRFMSRH